MPSASDPSERNDVYLRRSNLVLAFLAAIFLAMLVFGVTSRDHRASGDEIAASVGGRVQHVTLFGDEDRYPVRLGVRAGIPLEMVVPRQAADRLVFPELRLTFPVSDRNSVRVPPLDKGVYGFSCPGGYVRGTITAR